MNPLRISLGKRRQLFEIQDFPWCPKTVRDGVTELLALNLRILPLYEPAILELSKLAKKTDGHWVDLCAGSGGGSVLLKQKMPGEIKDLTLTDLYPPQNFQASEGIRYYPEAVDARNVPAELPGMRTLFTSFHHLPDDVALAVLKDARDSKTPIAVFEFTERNILGLLMVLPSFFTSFFLVPLILPWKLSRFFWTYCIPLIPLVAFIDIVLSCFRTRDPRENEALVSTLTTPDYHWRTGYLKTYLGMRLTYLIGQSSK